MKNKKKKSIKCPICGDKILKSNEYLPFCSKKCGDIDLSRWLDSKYFIAEDKEVEK